MVSSKDVNVDFAKSKNDLLVTVRNINVLHRDINSENRCFSNESAFFNPVGID